MASDDGLPFYHPERKSPPRRLTLAPRERLWEIRRDHLTWSVELIFRGENYGFEARVLRDGELTVSQRFVRHDHAVEWADEQRRDIERGWLDG